MRREHLEIRKSGRVLRVHPIDRRTGSVGEAPLSARKLRTRVTTSRSDPTAASAAGSVQAGSPSGYGVTIKVPGRPVSFSQISSVTNGMKG